MAEEQQWTSVKEVGVVADRNAKHRRTMEVLPLEQLRLTCHRMHTVPSINSLDLNLVVSSVFMMVCISNVVLNPLGHQGKTCALFCQEHLHKV